ncbi:MAG: PilZ domain-containing protein [Acidobacteriota bacterium]
MAESCTVLIAADALLPALKECGFEDGGELLAFADNDALRALDVISRRRPRVVALERTFAATPRGAALIKRIRADPTLSGSAIHVVPYDDDSRDGSPGASGNRAGGPEPMSARPPLPAADAVILRAPPLDRRGTRRAPRYRIDGEMEVILDGNRATLVDLSTIGAQVLSVTIVKPNQKLRMTIADDLATLRVNAIVAWAFFEMPPKVAPRYRAGIEFLDANAAEIDAYRRRRTWTELI